MKIAFQFKVSVIVGRNFYVLFKWMNKQKNNVWKWFLIFDIPRLIWRKLPPHRDRLKS